MEKIINRALIVSLILAAAFGGTAYFFRNYPHASAAGGKFTFPLLQYLDIDLQRLDVNIVPYDGEEITLEYKNDRPLEIETGDNELRITESDKFIVSLFAGSEAEFGLTIYLPRAEYREISIYAATGSISVGETACRKLSAVTESGDIAILGASYPFSLSTTRGRISAELNSVADGSDILNREGDVELTVPPESSFAVDFSTKDGECISGLIRVQIEGDYLYSFNGGKQQISVTADHGTFTFDERK